MKLKLIMEMIRWLNWSLSYETKIKLKVLVLLVLVWDMMNCDLINWLGFGIWSIEKLKINFNIDSMVNARQIFILI